MIESNRGSGRIGCLITLLIFAVAGYVGMKVGPVYYNAQEFEDALQVEGVKAGARFYTDEVILDDIMKLARSFEIPIKEENVKINRAGGQLIIAVEYSVPVEFEIIGYTHIFRFTARTKNLIGTL